MKKERGEHFDPDILDVFLLNIDEILKIMEQVGPAKDVSLTEFVWSERDKTDPLVSASK
jgi:putative two-component system response regulator